MSEPTNWLMVFLRVSADVGRLSRIFHELIFPCSCAWPSGALIAVLICPALPARLQPQDIFGLVGLMAMEVVAGLSSASPRG